MFFRTRQLIRENRVLLRFYLLFAYLVLLLYLCLQMELTHRWIAVSLPGFVAGLVAWFLSVVGMDAQAFGTTVSIVDGLSFRIIYHCTGLFLMSIYASAVWAYPATWLERLLGLVLGLPVLFGLNVLRLAALGIVGKYFPQYFDLSHEYLWQGLLIVFVLVLWVQWRDRIVTGRGQLRLAT